MRNSSFGNSGFDFDFLVARNLELKQIKNDFDNLRDIHFKQNFVFTKQNFYVKFKTCGLIETNL